MRSESRRGLRISLLIVGILAAGTLLTPSAAAQSPELQEKVAEVKQAVAQNKQALAEYTWTETVIISLKGEQKKQEHFQVRLDPNGKPQKTSLDAPLPAQEANSGRGGRLKEHVVEKKKEEFKEYADQIRTLIQQYVPLEKDLFEKAFQQGNISLAPEAGTPGQYRLLITNYIKQGDNMTLVIDKAQKSLAGVSISSYLNDPKDAVKVSVQFTAIPQGPNHVAQETIDAVSKQLNIVIQNSNYQRL